LYHDLALATDSCGSDMWAHREFFIPGCRVGAPPDDFSPSGQDWSFPPPNGQKHREDGYRLYAESIRKSSRHGGALRIDHVMRLFRLYWIPQGHDATHGAYVRDLTNDMVRILALESVRNQVVIVGEDLGTVEPEVRETLSGFGILSYRLLYFERVDGRFRAPDEYPEQALASTTTHDLATITGFWTANDIQARLTAGTIDRASFQTQMQGRARDKQSLLDALHAAGLLPWNYARNAADIPELTGELHYAIIGYLASTPSVLWLLNQEDMTKEPAQQNLPGTTSAYPNWSRKMNWSIRDLSDLPVARDCAAMVRNWIDRTGRFLRLP
jgi:4-alpha-glucanotransferase